jgi:hypothetical protein
LGVGVRPGRGEYTQKVPDRSYPTGQRWAKIARTVDMLRYVITVATVNETVQQR